MGPAAPTRPPGVTAIVVALLLLAGLGVFITRSGATNDPGFFIIDFIGLFLMAFGLTVTVAAGTLVVATWWRWPLVALQLGAAGFLAVLIFGSGLVLVSPDSPAEGGGTPMLVCVVGLVAGMTILAALVPESTRAALRPAPPPVDWQGLASTQAGPPSASRPQHALARKVEQLPPRAQGVLAAVLLLVMLWMIAGPPVPNGPSAAALAERVDVLGMERQLGPPAERTSTPRRFWLLKAHEERVWFVDGTVAEVAAALDAGVDGAERDGVDSLVIEESCRSRRRHIGESCLLRARIRLESWTLDSVRVELDAESDRSFPF
jgi:hypothetical protein